MVTHILLDVDNTLLDFDAYVKNTLRDGFSNYGLKPYEPYMFDVFTKENNLLWKQIEQANLTFEELEKIRFDIIFDKLGINFDGPTFECYFRQALYDSAIPVDGALSLLQSLKSKGYSLSVASNGPTQQQLHRLSLAGMDQYFDAFFISERLGVSKPATLFFEKALQELCSISGTQVYAEQCAVIGDSLSSDMHGGRLSGMQTIFFNRKRVVPSSDVDMQANTLWEIEPFFPSLK